MPSGSLYGIYFVLRRERKPEDYLGLMNAFWEEDKHKITIGDDRSPTPIEIQRPDDAMRYVMEASGWQITLYIRGAYGADYKFKTVLLSSDSKGPRNDMEVIAREYYSFFIKEDNPARYNERKLVRIIKKAYESIHPYHVYLARGEFPSYYFGFPRNPWSGDYYEAQKYLLNQVNIFSPEIVERLGRERLLGIDAHILETLDDGGIFIVPCPLSDDSDDCMMSGKFHVPVDKETEEWYWKLYIPGTG